MSFDISGLTEKQRLIFCDPSRFKVVIAGRRFGKTILALYESLYSAQERANAVVWYVAPTYRMAKEIFWDELKRSIPQRALLAKNESELWVKLKGCNSKIALKGADNPDSLRGSGLDKVIADEFADINPSLWTEVLRPALADKRGSALFIGTPKGFNHAYDMFTEAQSAKDWSAFQFTTAQGGNVSQSEIEAARSAMSLKQFNQEFNASFETLSNRVYSSFSRDNNVDSSVAGICGELYIGMDFNINPMSAVIGVRIVDQLHIFDEITIQNGTTSEMCEEIKSRYGTRKILVYPDPSGKARKTSAPVGQTDFTIIREYGWQIIAPSKAPLVVDRVNEMNALFMNANGYVRCYIHPRCKMLIKSLEGLTYKPKTSIPDKSLGLDHLPDALGYLIHSEFPIIKKNIKQTNLLGI